MVPRKTTRSSMVEELWRPYLKLVDNRLLRRGKALAPQGVVTRLVVKDQTIQCQVKSTSFGRGVYYVSLPCVDWWRPYILDVAAWLSYRPDWLGAFLARALDEEFLTFATDAGLRLFPNEKTAQRIFEQASCTCHDIESPCKHIVTTVCEVILDIEKNPLRAFEYVGVAVDELLDLVHGKTAEVLRDSVDRAGAVARLPEDSSNTFEHEDSQSQGAQRFQRSRGSQPFQGAQIEVEAKHPSFSISVWPEERKVWENDSDEDNQSSHLHQMKPVFDENKLRALRENYIAGE